MVYLQLTQRRNYEHTETDTADRDHQGAEIFAKRHKNTHDPLER